MKKTAILFISALALFLPAVVYGAAGSSSGLILIQPVCARAVAMGDAFSAVSDDINAVYYNPAGLLLYNRKEFSASYLKGVLDFSYYSAGFYSSFNNSYALGGNLSAFSAGEAEINNVDGTSRNVTAMEDSVYTATLAKNLGGDFSAGANIKYINSAVAGEFKNEAYPLDIGLLYRKDNIDKRIGIGLCIQNLGGSLKTSAADDEGEKLPQVTRAGFSYTSRDEAKIVTFSADALQLQEDPGLKIHMGLEYALGGRLSLRAGYKAGYDLASLTAGFGVEVNGANIDIAATMMGVLGYTYNVSISFKL
ncbi:MAG: hypothetical protein A2297_00110 [Elusimicrobia bacterium RIFOXYB2_FULL_48_7]|nr:MAG: hypothetical protein A2297_00110 [Elusimicrobia bacterium RIFOXYB2_FULL_48_7]